MFCIFQQAIKFDCLFLDICQSFYWFVSFIVDKSAFFCSTGSSTSALKGSEKKAWLRNPGQKFEQNNDYAIKA